MVIRQSGRQTPKQGFEWGWYKQHKKQLRNALFAGKCPGCGRSLGRNDILFDLGFDIGLECEYCR